MELLRIIAIALLSVLPPDLIFCQTQSTLPPAYVVHTENLRATAMSPNEKYLAVLVRKGAGAEVQVWDFMSGSLVEARSLHAPELRPNYPGPTNYVRYTSDDELLAVYTGGDLLRVLRTRDLDEVRAIEIHSATKVTAFEASPTDHRVAIRMAGEVPVYDLDSGEELRKWSIDQYSLGIRNHILISENRHVLLAYDGSGKDNVGRI